MIYTIITKHWKQQTNISKLHNIPQQKKTSKKNKAYLDMLGPDIRGVTGRNLVDDMDRHHPLFTFPRRHLHLLLINPTNPFFFFFLIVFFVFNYSGDGRTTGDSRSNGERGGVINTRGCGWRGTGRRPGSWMALGPTATHSYHTRRKINDLFTYFRCLV